MSIFLTIIHVYLWTLTTHCPIIKGTFLAIFRSKSPLPTRRGCGFAHILLAPQDIEDNWTDIISRTVAYLKNSDSWSSSLSQKDRICVSIWSWYGVA